MWDKTIHYYEPGDADEAKASSRSLATWVRGELTKLHRLIVKLCRACERVARTVAALPADSSSTWPLEYIGTEGEIRTETSRQIGARNPHLDLRVRPELSDLPIFVTLEAARPVEELHRAFAVRVAWGQIFHELGPVLAPPTKAKPQRRKPTVRAGKR